MSYKIHLLVYVPLPFSKEIITFVPMKQVILLLLLVVQTIPLCGQVETDSAVFASSRMVKSERWFKPQQVIVPAALITAGAVAVGNPRLCEMKMNVRDAFQQARGDHHKANVEVWATLSAQLFTMIVSPRAKHKFIDRMLVKATSYALLYTTMPIVRRCVYEPRPDGHGKHAFPSLKTANAFMAAEQTRIERGWGWGLGMYGFAAGIGVLQMYNDRVYINDVIAGMGAGILAVHASYWLLPLERRWLGLDKRSPHRETGLLFLPTYEPQTRTAGVVFAMQL